MSTEQPRTFGQLLRVVLLSWLGVLGIDFLAYGGVFAGLFQEGNGFFLSPLELFRRIPAGYLSFLLMVGFLVWLMVRFDTRGGRDGLKLGCLVGAVVGASHLMGLWSIAPAPLRLLLIWWGVQVVELGVGGAIAGTAFSGVPFWKLTLIVVVGVMVMFVATIVMQNTGLTAH